METMTRWLWRNFLLKNWCWTQPTTTQTKFNKGNRAIVYSTGYSEIKPNVIITMANQVLPIRIQGGYKARVSNSGLFSFCTNQKASALLLYWCNYASKTMSIFLFFLLLLNLFVFGCRPQHPSNDVVPQWDHSTLQSDNGKSENYQRYYWIFNWGKRNLMGNQQVWLKQNYVSWLCLYFFNDFYMLCPQQKKKLFIELSFA